MNFTAGLNFSSFMPVTGERTERMTKQERTSVEE